MVDKIRSKTDELYIYGAVPVPYVPAWVTRGALTAHRSTYIVMHLITAGSRCTAGLLFPSQYLCGRILLTLWDWRVLSAGPMILYWPKFFLLIFSPSLLSFYGLILWGWGLRTDRV